MPLQLDASQRPLMVVSGHGDLNLDEYSRYLTECTREFFQSGEPYTLIFDATGMTTMSSKIRKLQAEWINEHRSSIQKLCRGTAFVLTSSFQRGVLTAVHWVSSPPYPFTIVATFDEAKAWADKQLQLP